MLFVPPLQAASKPFQAGLTAARPALPYCPLQHLVRTASTSLRCSSLRCPTSPVPSLLHPSDASLNRPGVATSLPNPTHQEAIRLQLASQMERNLAGKAAQNLNSVFDASIFSKLFHSLSFYFFPVATQDTDSHDYRHAHNFMTEFHFFSPP